MALRTTCLCNGKIIGIESIFTVVNGMQINIPGKVEVLRKRSKKNELFCPCGCGANLTLVAGDKNLREQHFRIRNGLKNKACSFIAEGPTSIYSKIVLKCWLDEKLPETLIESRVPVCAVEDTNRCYEMTLLSKERAIAISYCRERENLSDDKIEILESNQAGIHIHYIADIKNRGFFIQYPEMMMKIQSRQGYCLYLSVPEDRTIEQHYALSKLEVFYYAQKEDGSWQELPIISEKLSDYMFDENGSLFCKSFSVAELVQKRYQRYKSELENRKKEWEMKQAEAAQKAREQEAQEKAKRECTREKIEAAIDKNQTIPFKDPYGQRWVRCEYCGKVDIDSEFSSYGGKNHVNLGQCSECSRSGAKNILPQYAKFSRIDEIAQISKPSAGNLRCPKCGGRLVLKKGKYGAFWGCSDYPKCKYTKNA